MALLTTRKTQAKINSTYKIMKYVNWIPCLPDTHKKIFNKNSSAWMITSTAHRRKPTPGRVKVTSNKNPKRTHSPRLHKPCQESQQLEESGPAQPNRTRVRILFCSQFHPPTPDQAALVRRIRALVNKWGIILTIEILTKLIRDVIPPPLRLHPNLFKNPE